VEVEDGTLSLEEQIAGRFDDGSIRAVALRLVDTSDVVVASARGEQLGDRVDWTLELPLGELRLRQLLHAVPSRRTVLDHEGRAWRIRADMDAPSWTAELPERAGAIDAVFVTWFACHLDAVGVERCYGPDDGPVLTGSDTATRVVGGDARWMPVGSPAVRPEVPTASSGGSISDERPRRVAGTAPATKRQQGASERQITARSEVVSENLRGHPHDQATTELMAEDHPRQQFLTEQLTHRAGVAQLGRPRGRVNPFLRARIHQQPLIVAPVLSSMVCHVFVMTPSCWSAITPSSRPTSAVIRPSSTVSTVVPVKRIVRSRVARPRPCHRRRRRCGCRRLPTDRRRGRPRR
jgi:hypothetical protein